MSMTVKVVLPSGVFFEHKAAKLVAEAHNGSFCLLPRHVDFVTSLVAGIVSITPAYETNGQASQPPPKIESAEIEDIYIAVDQGILVKRGPHVVVSTWNAVRGPLGELNQAVQAQFQELGEHDQKARQALEHLEASLVRQVLGREGA